MNFQGLQKIETADKYIDRAYRKGRVVLDEKREDMKLGRKLSKERKSQRMEGDRIEIVRKVLVEELVRIHTSYPRFSQFDPFYKELAAASLNLDAIRLALASVKWAAGRIDYVARIHKQKIRNVPITEVNKVRNSFLGRTSSILKQINQKLVILEDGRRILKKFPAIKTGLFTVVLAGFPNVGKSSLLKALTGSDPEINSYPFTTKRLMLGYIKTKEFKVQVIDSPGLLDRPRDKINDIESHAALALEHLADAVLFVFDPSESCGYSVADQLHLLGEVKKSFSIPIFVLVNKSDLMKTQELQAITKPIKEKQYVVSATDSSSVDGLRSDLLELAAKAQKEAADDQESKSDA